MKARLLDVGDAAVTVEFGDGIDPALLAQVEAFDHAVLAAIADERLQGVIETVPTFRSLTILYDPLLTSRAVIDLILGELLATTHTAIGENGRLWRFPSATAASTRPDLDRSPRNNPLT